MFGAWNAQASDLVTEAVSSSSPAVCENTVTKIDSFTQRIKKVYPGLKIEYLNEVMQISGARMECEEGTFLDELIDQDWIGELKGLSLNSLDETENLPKLLLKTPNLQVLDFGDCVNNDMNGDLSVLAPAIAQMHDLQVLKLRTYSYAQGLSAFVKTLSEIEGFEMPSLKVFELSFSLMELGRDGGRALARFLSFMPNLLTLDLNGARLGNELVAIAHSIAKMRNLQVLNLSTNRINGVRMIKFVNALSKAKNFAGMPNLKVLNLQYNKLVRLDLETCHAFEKLLSFMPNLSELNLSSNLRPLSVYGWYVYRNAKDKDNPRTFSDAEFEILIPAILKMNNLRLLDLRANEIYNGRYKWLGGGFEPAMTKFVNGISKTKVNHSLIINLRKNGMDADEGEIFQTAVSAHNPNITLLFDE